MSLRLRINLLITVLMCLFAVALGRTVIDDTRSSIREEIEAGTKVTVQMLSAVVLASEFGGMPRPFLLSFLQRLGRVRANQIRLLDTASGSVIYESPPSQYKAGRNAPNWYARLVMPDYQPTNILLRGARVEVIPDPSRATLDAWDDLMHLLLLAGLFFVVVNALVFWFVSRSMRPMEHIQRGLAEMEAGGVDITLPDFRLPEFRRISEAFNRMTQALGDAMAENRRVQAAEIELKHNRSMARLLEDERRGIAQELHDELGQCVTAIRSIAESIGQREDITRDRDDDAGRTIAKIYVAEPTTGRRYDRKDVRLHRGAVGQFEEIQQLQGRVVRTEAEQFSARLVDVGDVPLAVGRRDEIAAIFRERDELLASVVGASLIFDIDVHADPLRDRAVGIEARSRADELPAIRSVRHAHAKRILVEFARCERGAPLRARPLAIVGMQDFEPAIAERAIRRSTAHVAPALADEIELSVGRGTPRHAR